MKKNNKKHLRKIADRLYILAVLKKKGDRCEICGREAVTVHHFIPKSRSEAVRYDIENGVPVCNGCHKKIHSWDPHLSGIVVLKRGEDWYFSLLRRSSMVVSGRVTIQYLKEKIKILKKELNEYNNHN